MFTHIGIKDIIDITLFALILSHLYGLIKTSGLKPLFIGIFVFLVIYLLVFKVFEMTLLGSVLDQIVNVGLILLIILFQDQVKRFLTNLGSKNNWKFISIFSKLKKKKEQDVTSVITIVLACINMAKTNTGAIIVVQNNLLLGLYEQTGEIINAQVSSRLIENIFFKNSPLHDGAMIIEGSRIRAAGCILPISQNPNIPKNMGLRHRAGIGISQETDAKIIIVSEERGKISYAQEGKLRANISPEELQKLLLS